MTVFVHFRRPTLDLPQPHRAASLGSPLMKTLMTTVLGLGLLASSAAMAAPGPGSAAHRERPLPATAAAHGGLAQPSRQAGHQAAHAAPLHVGQAQRHKAPPAPPRAAQRHYKGDRLAVGQRGARMSDWRSKGLRSPGRGQEWRQLDGRYLLIASANGLILDILSARR